MKRFFCSSEYSHAEKNIIGITETFYNFHWNSAKTRSGFKFAVGTEGVSVFKCIDLFENPCFRKLLSHGKESLAMTNLIQ